MPSKSHRLKTFLTQAGETLAATNRWVFSAADLRALQSRATQDAISAGEFTDLLIREGLIQRVSLKSDRYRGFTRYVRPGASRFELALSLRKDSYLSHATAMYLHKLGEQVPNRIYVNKEQSEKAESGTPLTQESVDRAFQAAQRHANYILDALGFQIVLLNGKNTKQLEVGELPGPNGEPLAVTKLERTLIDIVVRPAYAGGPFQVLEAFQAAKTRISVGTLLATLKRLGYRYPYHQAIGYYMERAGYPEQLLRRVEQLPISFDFYLSHGRGPTRYAERWRLHVPNSL